MGATADHVCREALPWLLSGADFRPSYIRQGYLDAPSPRMFGQKANGLGHGLATLQFDRAATGLTREDSRIAKRLLLA